MSTELVAATAFALGAGAATFFAPCAYALLPGYVGYYVAAVGGDSPPLSGALARGTAAAVGAVATLSALSGIALVAGGTVRRALPVIEPLIGVALVALGLAVVFRVGSGVHVPLPARRAGIGGFAVFGALYALAAAACVLPLFLAVAIQSTTMSATAAATVLGAYAASFGGLLLAVTVATAVGHGVGAGRIAGHVDRLVTLAGVVLVVAGLGQLYVAFVL